MNPNRNEILEHLLEVLRSMGDEWEDSEAISEDSQILGNLNWRSIEIVYMTRAVQQHYDQLFPFEELLKEIEARKDQDVTVGEIVDFIYEHIGKGQPLPPE